MTPEQRREMIVRTALPLVAEHGTAVTTGQIARAAGIGEATIFRVFADKDELLDACVAAAVRTDHVLAELASIPMDQPLPARLIEAGAAIEAYLTRMGMVIGALHATGRRGRRLPPEPVPKASAQPDPAGTGGAGAGETDEHAGRWQSRETAMNRTRDALAELFEPERDRLRLPVDQMASLFMGFAFSRGRSPAGPDVPNPSMEDYVDVFLNGALKDEEGATK
ncbi:TetR/AcrR family transcriptional regulator [Actinomadura decatromicini]|uniref:TetR/AcrR family transcriptional regulator n=2 Tax=Actinomadura decatromicini TaxID=2604572 RepID=A0A5D3F5T0_9ACTN|nr:TetR/AcrR family transcriptional regulator [Actinomadura decatromicini]